MNETKFSRLDPAAGDPWKKKTEPAPPKKEKSVRLTIDLNPNARGCSSYIFSYEDLVKKARAKEEASKNGVGGLPDLFSNDSVEELKNIASKYEQKYGRDPGGKRRYQSYADLGAGYDEDDSFIDNTEAGEEGIPEEMDTKKGGFYINSGKLELTNRRFATQKLISAVGEYESQLKSRKQLEQTLTASLAEKEEKLQQIQRDVQRIAGEAAAAENKAEFLKRDFQKKFNRICKVCADVIDQVPDGTSEYT